MKKPTISKLIAISYTFLSLLSLKASSQEALDYPVSIAQTSCWILNHKTDKTTKLHFVENAETKFLIESLFWELKEEVLHPNAGGRLSNLYITGSFQQNGKFLLKGWFIKGPIIIETIDIHKDTSTIKYESRLQKSHFGNPNSISSDKSKKFLQQLVIHYHAPSQISWIGEKPHLLKETAETDK